MKPPANLAASVRQRLFSLAKTRGEELQLLLARYGVERLLYRLSRTESREHFVLKGAVLFYVWDGEPHRPTRDVDFSAFGDPSTQAIADVFRTVCATEVEPDGLVFLPESVAVEPIRDRQAYGGVRVTLMALLGSARIPLRVDVGFGDAITPAPRVEMIPTLLDFPAPRVRAYPAETVVAEKFQAMVSLGVANTRLKDFFDVWTLLQTREFDGAVLADAIEATFRRRSTPIPTRAPLALTDAFGLDPEKRSQWARFLERSHITDAPVLDDVVERIAGFVLPPALARSEAATFAARWTPSRGWTPVPKPPQ